MNKSRGRTCGRRCQSFHTRLWLCPQHSRQNPYTCHGETNRTRDSTEETDQTDRCLCGHYNQVWVQYLHSPPTSSPAPSLLRCSWPAPEDWRDGRRPRSSPTPEEVYLEENHRSRRNEHVFSIILTSLFLIYFLISTDENCHACVSIFTRLTMHRYIPNTRIRMIRIIS